jgi:hypothetical protein
MHANLFAIALTLAAAPSPQQHADVAAPRWKGIGLLTSGAALGVAGLALHATATADSIRVARQIESGELDPGQCVENCSISFAFHTVGGILSVSSLGLTGGGMHMWGRHLAHKDARTGRVRRGRVIAGVGAGLIGVGVSLFATSQALGWTVADAGSEAVAVFEGGFYPALAMTMAGSAMAGFGHGYERERRKNRKAYVRFSPWLGKGTAGISFTGRF